MNCNLCGSESLEELGFIGKKPAAITSEPKLCSIRAKIYYCQSCHHLQKVHTETELSFIDSVYKNYDTYNISQGKEQLVFPDSGPPRPRSYQAIAQCISLLPQKGNLLDIGTGNGAILKSASQLLPEWNLFAFDLSEKFKEDILTIPGVVDFYAENINNLPKEKFNLIVLWHCLEHIPQPAEFLSNLKKYLIEGGLLLIQVPDVRRTPFDFAIIDHCSHFTRTALIKLCQSVGFSVAMDGYDWVHNCITLLLKSENNLDFPTFSTSESWSPDNYFYWLNQTIENFERSTQETNYAVFGTGISGIWVSSQLSKTPRFFIDEDQDRIGNKINNIPIISPEKLPPEIDIIMPFTPETARKIAVKIKQQYSGYNSRNFILSKPYF